MHFVLVMSAQTVPTKENFYATYLFVNMQMRNVYVNICDNYLKKAFLLDMPVFVNLFIKFMPVLSKNISSVYYLRAILRDHLKSCATHIINLTDLAETFLFCLLWHKTKQSTSFSSLHGNGRWIF